MINKKLLSLVFVSTNERGPLLDCLESLYSSPPNVSYEVVVVDNASSDLTANLASTGFADLKLISRTSRHGLPSNLNYGISQTTGEFIILCNPDLLFLPGAVDALVDFAVSRPRAGLVAPALLEPAGDIRLSCRTFYTFRTLVALRGPLARWTRKAPGVRKHLMADWDHAKARRVDWAACSCVLVRRSAMQDVGGMDERFVLYFDDVDIALRLWKRGWEVWYEPAARVVHLEQRSSTRLLSWAWRMHFTSLAKFWWKHKGLGPKSSRHERLQEGSEVDAVKD